VIKRILVLLPLCLSFALGQTEWQVTKTFPIGGTSAWDYLAVDSSAHRLYVPRGTHTLVIDSETGKTVADLPGQKVAHGVAIVPAAGRGFISDGGGAGAIVIFDLATNVVLGSIAAQPDADGIIFDPGSGFVIVVSGDKGTMMLFKPDIDPKKGKIATAIDLGGAPEFLAADAGKVYVNLMDKDEVAVVDIETKKVISRWPVAPGGAPVGLALDPRTHRLYLGCRKPQRLISMSSEDGKILGDVPVGDHVDAVKIENGQIFASAADGTLSIARETAEGKLEIVQTVATPKGARTMGVDSATHRIFLPTAEYRTGTTTVKPNTFKIVVVEQTK